VTTEREAADKQLITPVLISFDTVLRAAAMF